MIITYNGPIGPRGKYDVTVYGENGNVSHVIRVPLAEVPAGAIKVGE